MRLTDLLNGPRVDDLHGRDNNFNLIRFLAATLVIWGHAFGLLDRTALEPVFHAFGIGSGDVAVDVFFVLSGFLVSKSWDRKTPSQFVWARLTRIYPGLWASIIVSVLIVSVLFASEPALRFLTSPGTAAYLLHNATMLPTLGARLTLPHAFHYPGDQFNVPLWTLPYELQMYGLLAVVGLTVGLRAPFVGILAVVGAAGVALDESLGYHLMTVDRGRFLYLFFIGALAYTLRRHIVLRAWIAAACMLLVAATVALRASYPARQAALLLALPYLVLWCGLVPGGFLRLWNRLGDYSYGMYIYGCPIQIALISTGATTATGSNFLLSMLITLPVAVASWHFVERRALQQPLPVLFAQGSARRALESSNPPRID